MAQVIITFKLMPSSPDVDWDSIQVVATEMIAGFGDEVGKSSVEPLAFGLKSLNLIFVMDEDKGSTDELEEQISGLDGVESVEVTDVRRALG